LSQGSACVLLQIYFDGMFYGDCIEARKGEIKLPDDNHEDIAAFAKWAITGNIYA